MVECIICNEKFPDFLTTCLGCHKTHVMCDTCMQKGFDVRGSSSRPFPCPFCREMFVPPQMIRTPEIPADTPRVARVLFTPILATPPTPSATTDYVPTITGSSTGYVPTSPSYSAANVLRHNNGFGDNDVYEPIIDLNEESDHDEDPDYVDDQPTQGSPTL